MVATALNRPNIPNANAADDFSAAGSRERIASLLDPAFKRLKNRLVILGIFAIVYLLLGWTYWVASSDRQALSGDINSLRAELSVNPAQTAGLEADLASYTSAISAAREQQILILKDSGILEKILLTTESAGVTVASAGISDNSVAPLGEDIYEVTPILLQVDGSLEQLEAFIRELEGRAITSMEVDSSSITSSEEGYSATIRAIVYNKPVSPDDLIGDDDVPTGRVTNEELDRAAGGGQ